jgi:hypothetical protein
VLNHASVVKLLLKCGADGTQTTTQTVPLIDAGSTALDIARLHSARYAETLAVLRLRCCSTCGVTSSGGWRAGEEQHLKRCALCPASAPPAIYCSEQCQRADWVPRHRGECAEARGRVRLAAGTEV